MNAFGGRVKLVLTLLSGEEVLSDVRPPGRSKDSQRSSSDDVSVPYEGWKRNETFRKFERGPLDRIGQMKAGVATVVS